MLFIIPHHYEIRAQISPHVLHASLPEIGQKHQQIRADLVPPLPPEQSPVQIFIAHFQIETVDVFEGIDAVPVQKQLGHAVQVDWASLELIDQTVGDERRYNRNRLVEFCEVSGEGRLGCLLYSVLRNLLQLSLQD